MPRGRMTWQRLPCKGLSVPTNFPVEGYTESLTEIGGSSRVSPHSAAHVCRCSGLSLVPVWCPLDTWPASSPAHTSHTKR